MGFIHIHTTRLIITGADARIAGIIQRALPHVIDAPYGPQGCRIPPFIKGQARIHRGFVVAHIKLETVRTEIIAHIGGEIAR